MLLVEYSPDITGYSNHLFAVLRPKFELCKFNLVMTHVVIDADSKTQINLGREDILQMIDRDELERPPLQENSVYFFCKMGSAKSASYIVKLLAGGIEKQENVTIRLSPLSFFEKDYYKETNISIRKDIIILSDEDKEIGWYNIKSNILWASDLGHYPEYAHERIAKLLDQIYEYKTYGEISVLPNLTIGVDPEFELYSSDIESIEDAPNKFIPANSCIADPDRNLEIGHNGHSETGEIRPAPANHPLKLARNIKRTIRKLFRHPNFEDFSICVGGGFLKDLGGHIHFNLEAMPTKLLYILYDLIAVHIRVGMNDSSRRKRDENRMGRNNPIEPTRRTSWGGIEWRVLPSFIINDIVCKAILCTTWVVIKAYYNGELIKESYDSSLTPSILRGLSLYPAYKEYIDKFIELFIAAKTPMEAQNIRKTWDVPSVNMPYNIRIKSNIKWINRYFSPINSSLTNKVKLLINTSDNPFLRTIGRKIPEDIIREVRQFAAAHFINYEHVEATPKGKRQADLELLVPYSWAEIKDDREAFKAIKGLIQSIIIKLSISK